VNISLTKNFGRYLRARRHAIGLSQKEVSKILGYPNVQSVANWERGVASPPPRKFNKVIKAYRVSGEELLDILLSEVEQSLRHFLK
jgi:transcriptional regulator with XRE-family HTH domain